MSDSRPASDSPGREQIRRRRVCTQCKRRFTTYERIGAPSLRVIKRSEKSEEFSSDKLRACLARVCRNRPVTEEVQAQLVNKIEADLLDAGTKKVPSWRIVERLLARLRELDRVSADRLAADYLDDDGVLRVRPGADDGDGDSQLGLFDSDSDAD